MQPYLRKLRKLRRLATSPAYLRGLRYGIAAAIEHVPLLKQLDCQTVIDIGANVGQFTLATRSAIPAARVIAFEPLEEPARVFRRAFAHDPQVELHQVAIGPEAATVTMHVSNRIDSSSILPMTAAQTQIFPGTQRASYESVRIVRLSSLVNPTTLVGPTLLKLDVQGYELQVLEGCREALAAMEHVYVECSFIELYEGQALADDVVQFLREHGFAVEGVYNVTYAASGRAVQADFHFRRRR